MNCKRCNEVFECKSNDIENCQCNSVQISEETQQYLAKTNYNCLCRNCLKELNVLVEKTKTTNFPKKSGEMIEGIHFYMEGEYFVFTEFYHLLRGNCCKSGCRHCAYGFKFEKNK